MSKKGFTLVELLAVIVILGVVMTIGSISVATVRRKIDKNMFENKLEFVIAAGKEWGNDNKALVKSTGDGGKVMTVDDLITNGVLKTEELELADGTFSCGKPKNDVEVGKTYCYAITNNVDGSVVNNLNIKIYMKHNRVYACIVSDDYNYAILGDNAAHDEYGHLNYYCT